MASNPHGLDYKYFECKIAIMHRDGLSSWKPDELARELARMSRTADAAVMHEPEFTQPQGQPAAWKTGSITWGYEADARRHAEQYGGGALAVVPLYAEQPAPVSPN